MRRGSADHLANAQPNSGSCRAIVSAARSQKDDCNRHRSRNLDVSGKLLSVLSLEAAIKEAVVGKLLEQVVVAALGAAGSASSATVQLQAVLQEIERLHKNRFMQDKSLHDVVATAMRENWTSVRPYVEGIESVVAQVIADGQAHGEFRNGNSMTVARCVLATTDFCTNPLLIGANTSYARPTSSEMLAFCVGGLREV